jgi:hypothetical protein
MTSRNSLCVRDLLRSSFGGKRDLPKLQLVFSPVARPSQVPHSTLTTTIEPLGGRRSLDRWTADWMDGQTDRQMDRQTDGYYCSSRIVQVTTRPFNPVDDRCWETYPGTRHRWLVLALHT